VHCTTISALYLIRKEPGVATPACFSKTHALDWARCRARLTPCRLGETAPRGLTGLETPARGLTADSGVVVQKRGILGKLPRLDAVLKEGARLENLSIDHG
jgi:hypothetical protein